MVYCTLEACATFLISQHALLELPCSRAAIQRAVKYPPHAYKSYLASLQFAKVRQHRRVSFRSFCQSVGGMTSHLECLGAFVLEFCVDAAGWCLACHGRHPHAGASSIEADCEVLWWRSQLNLPIVLTCAISTHSNQTRYVLSIFMRKRRFYKNDGLINRFIFDFAAHQHIAIFPSLVFILRSSPSVQKYSMHTDVCSGIEVVLAFSPP